MELNHLWNVAYIVSPAVAFLPQIYMKKIVFSPLLSALVILSNIMKLFHFHIEPYDHVLLYQSIILIALHFYLIYHYKQPLRRIELQLFRPTLFLKHGLSGCTAGLVTVALVIFQLAIFMGLGRLFGHGACALDLAVTVLQLVIYKGALAKPYELFVCWIAGDAAKLFMMAFCYNTPLIYSACVAAQLAINTYVLFN